MTLVAVAVMIAGLLGTVVPVLPGLSLIWIAALGAWLTTAFGTLAWVSMILLTVVFAAGSIAKYVLPARTGRDIGAPRSSLAAAFAGAVVGFFVLPVVGFPIGGLSALWLAETLRLGDRETAWRSTVEVLRSYGIGVAVEVAAGVVMVATFVVTALVA